MPGHNTTRHVEWADCDAAGIVFYPNYFRWMDGAFHAMTRSIGFDQQTLTDQYGVSGVPLVHAECDFRAPAHCHDDLLVALAVTRLSQTTISLSYTFSNGGEKIAEGFETRVFVRRGEDGVEKTAIPPEIRQRQEQLEER